MGSRQARTLTLPIIVASSIAASINVTAPVYAASGERPAQPNGRAHLVQPERSAVDSDRSTPAVATVVRTAQAAPGRYTVVAGDTVSDIAGRFGLATASLLAMNGLSWSSVIYPGQVLSLATTAPASAPAERTETPTSSHTVAAGDTVSAIAARYNTTTAAILTANGLSPDSIIYPGQELVVAAPAPAIERASAPAPGGITELTAEMATNAQTIIDTARSIGVSDDGIVIALATAMQESSLRNLEGGHLDSVGLFQQRPSHGWGTPAQILDPVRSTLAFFGGPTNPNADTNGLLDIDGWEQLSVAEAAQAVQVSAHPDAYAKWEASAREWLSQLG